jgi:lipopolysaccharide export system permease protein
MTLISRYLFREYIRAVAACLLAALTLFLVIDFVEHADDLIRNRAGVGEIARYYLFRIPGIFVQVSPVAVLLAVLITVSLRSRTNELTAMFSSGISLLRISAPIVAGCALVSVLALGSAETLVPSANRKAREISQLRVKPGKPAAQFTGDRYWLRGVDAVLSAQVVDSAGQAVLGFEYFELDEAFRLVRRIDARTAAYRGNGVWELRNGTERTAEGNLVPRPFLVKTVAFPETVQGFLEGETPPEEMTYARLDGYIRASRARGYDVGRHKVDLHAKLSYPLLNIILGLLAVPVALRSPRAGGVWRSIGAGLLLGFVCWTVLSISLSLGRKGLLPPPAAAWLPGALFLIAAVLLFRRTRR